ncbi:ankyrin repeat domain-containing protein [Brachyspira hampsonii]|uniref:ankyrin repeat domain-containing protein n=1 Tax=Brachyspira hampsonii TaxID=1287055 RepID=UPI0002ADEF9F|nr:ankyrin repeat domain-containing protein [Brachyspira hampsonii]ELV05313.1 ankyrin repeat-containing protein [Brachyspira hampsonii 30599]
MNKAYTPLIYAIILGKTDTVRELIKRGADVNKTVTNQNSVTVPIITASSSGNMTY